MRRNIRWVAIAAAVLCFAGTLARMNQVWKDRSCFGIYYDAPEEGERTSDCLLRLKEEGFRAAAWEETEAVLENKNMGRCEEGLVCHVMGDKTVLYPESLCEGSYPLSWDMEGCLVSRELAYALFGSGQIVEEEVEIDGKAYRVRGMLKEPGIFAVVSANTDQGCSRIRIDTGKPDVTASAIQNLLAETGMKRGDAFFEGSLYSAYARIAGMLPVWVMLFWGLRYLLARFKNIRTGGNQLWGCAGAGAAVLLWAMAAAWLFRQSVIFSADYLPSMWSDFSFWTSLFWEKCSDWKSLQGQVLSAADQGTLHHLRDTVYLTAGTLACQMWWKLENMQISLYE